MKKKLLPLILVTMLSGCAAQPVYEETTKDNFTSEAENAEQALLDYVEEHDGVPYYTKAVIKGKVIATVSMTGAQTASQEYVLNATYKFDKTEKQWTNNAGETEAIADAYFMTSAYQTMFGFSIMELTKDELTFYVGDGFKIEGSYAGTMSMSMGDEDDESEEQIPGMEVTTNVEYAFYVFNKEGLLTSFEGDSDVVMSMDGMSMTTNTVVDVTVRYSR